MKASFGANGAIFRFIAKARTMAVHLIYKRTIPLLTVMFCAGVAATLWYMSRLSSKLVESGALQGTAIYSESITDLRTFYNSEVVDRARPLGVEVTHDYAAREGAIPIPATFTIEFGKHIAEKNSGMQIRLYSDYPFPFRKEGGPSDNFEKEAIVQLRKQPDKPFFRFENFQGRPSLRYGTAVQMKAGCVACHNSHPESPKTDWKVGDVRGVQEIIQTLESAVAQTRAGLKETFVLLSTMGLLGLGGLALVIGRMRRTSAELEQRVAERTAAEARLAALHEINLASTSTLDLRAVLDFLLEKTDRLLPFIAATTVGLLNRHTGELEPVACRNLDQDQWKAAITRSAESHTRMLRESNAPVMVLNAQTDPRSLAPEFLRKHGLVSFLRVPLLAKGKAIGILTFFTKEEHPFSDEEVDFLTTLAGQAAIAIQNAQLYQESQREEEIQKFLKELSQDITSLDIDSLFKKLTGKVQEIFRVDKADARIFADLRTWQNALRGSSLVGTGGTSRGRSRWMRQHGQPVVIPDITKEGGPFFGASTGDEKVRGYLAVPIFSREREVIGVLRIRSYQPRSFTQEEVNLLQQIANGAAIAIENTRLLEETEKRAQHLSALHSVTTSANRSLELDTILEEVLKKIRDTFRFEVTQIYLTDPKAGELHLRVAWDPRESTELHRKRKVFHLGEGNVGRVAETGEPIIFEDVYNDPKYQEWSSTKVSYRSGYRFFSAFPIRAKSKTIGVLSGISQSPRKLNEEEIRLLSSMTDQIGVCVENSQLYQETKQQALDLERSNKVKDEFLSVMSHELRTPLTAVVGYAGMLQDGFLGQINQEQAKGLGVLLDQTNDLLSLINSILDVTKMEAGTMVLEKEEVNLKSFLDGLRSTYDTPRDKSLTLVWDYADHLPRVTTDIGKLKHILENLLNNAIKFTSQGNVTLSARIRQEAPPQGKADQPPPQKLAGPPQEDQAETGNGQQSSVAAPYLEFKVADTGIGIPKEALPVIFEKFYQVDGSNTRLHSGVGLGLHIVKKYTELLGGKIEVDSEPDKGTVFTVTLPCEKAPPEVSSRRVPAADGHPWGSV